MLKSPLYPNPQVRGGEERVLRSLAVDQTEDHSPGEPAEIDATALRAVREGARADQAVKPKTRRAIGRGKKMRRSVEGLIGRHF